MYQEYYIAKLIFNAFVRVNNRLKYITASDLSKAGYPEVVLYNNINWSEIYDWCWEHFGKNYVCFGERHFFFTNTNDLTLFMLRWG